MFIAYPKIHRLGKEETEGILDGKVTIQEKVDGANTSIWMEGGEMKMGSRSRELSGGFNGFCDYVNAHEGIKEFFERFPDNRLYGEWLCLSGDTIIRKVSGGKGGNGNYMTLKQMYNYLHNPNDNRKKSWWQRYGMPLTYSLNPKEGKVLPNRIKRIEKTGVKTSFLMKTRLGFEIKSSSEHKFLTPRGYIKLSALSIGDVVGISQVVYEQRSGRRLMSGSRAIQYQHKKFIQDSGVCSRCGGSDSLELDHIDNDWLNNEISNFQVLCKSCHSYKSKEDGITPAHTKGYSYFFDDIVSIDNVGDEEMYDIEMEGTEELANFVANNFIVHNCRHTLSYNEMSYRHFYLFDVQTLGGEYWTQREVQLIAERFGIRFPTIFAVGTFKEDDIKQYVGKTTLGDKGEGVVIKRPGFLNKFGEHTYAKIVTQEFKEDNSLIFGGNQKHSDAYWEMYVVNKYCTLPRVEKIMNKIQPMIDKKLDFEHTSRVISTCYHDMITEECWEISNKVQSLDYKTLKRLSGKKFTQIYHDILNNSISVADKSE